ncbi:hypothetical protein [Sphingomonas sp. CCH10-B3]|uniref:hypothetical protein n=1 Tax=Sphingomonas sp. CCH10-B3 TaxID=1768757 RepID=UPI001E45C43F|nr:hypothetical protein [Sphingomonas sp. CCH10-B3]
MPLAAAISTAVINSLGPATQSSFSQSTSRDEMAANQATLDFHRKCERISRFDRPLPISPGFLRQIDITDGKKQQGIMPLRFCGIEPFSTGDASARQLMKRLSSTGSGDLAIAHSSNCCAQVACLLLQNL